MIWTYQFCCQIVAIWSYQLLSYLSDRRSDANNTTYYAGCAWVLVVLVVALLLDDDDDDDDGAIIFLINEMSDSSR